MLRLQALLKGHTRLSLFFSNYAFAAVLLVKTR